MKSEHLKWVFVAAAAGYIYYRWREGKDDGKIAGFELNPDVVVDSVMPWLKINPMVKPLAGAAAKSFIRNFGGFDKADAIEVKYKRMR